MRLRPHPSQTGSPCVPPQWTHMSTQCGCARVHCMRMRIHIRTRAMYTLLRHPSFTSCLSSQRAAAPAAASSHAHSSKWRDRCGSPPPAVAVAARPSTRRWRRALRHKRKRITRRCHAGAFPPPLCLWSLILSADPKRARLLRIWRLSRQRSKPSVERRPFSTRCHKAQQKRVFGHSAHWGGHVVA